MKETDLLMGQFAAQNLDSLSDSELDEFEALLDHPDNDLLAWILEQSEPPEPVQGKVLNMIINFKKSL
jgi:antitoxin CptB